MMGPGSSSPPGPPNSPLFADSTELKKSRRTSGQKIILFALLVVVVVLIFVFMAVNSERTIRDRENRERKPIMSDSSKLRNDLVAAAEASKYRVLEEQVAATKSPAQPDSSQVIIIQQPAPVKKKPRKLTDEEKEAGKRYRSMKQESLLSKSTLDGFDDLKTGSGTQASAASATPTREELIRRMLEKAAKGADGAVVSAADIQAMQGEDVNAYQHKLDFLTKAGGERTPQDYSTNTRKAPIAPMELKAGTVIPGLLLVGVNSDLPGTVVGQVSENVYDTATGAYLLIPQGTRILGVYDSKVTCGQKRVAIVWNRLIYPDGSSLNIAGSPGTDMAGYSGIKGKVDNHYGQLLIAALFTSFFSAAVNVLSDNEDDGNSSPYANSSNNKKSAKDVLVETTGVTIANIGAKLAEKALDIQPTIVIKPGNRFNVMVMQDVVFLRSWAKQGTRVAGF